MIFLAFTLNGVEAVLKMKNKGVHHIWCGSDTISKDNEISKQVSRFEYSLKEANVDVIEEALETIREHHPNEIIWIES